MASSRYERPLEEFKDEDAKNYKRRPNTQNENGLLLRITV
jgi:hypothetical protein